MRNRGMVLVITLASLLALAGAGMWLLMEPGQARVERPVVPRAGR